MPRQTITALALAITTPLAAQETTFDFDHDGLPGAVTQITVPATGDVDAFDAFQVTYLQNDGFQTPAASLLIGLIDPHGNAVEFGGLDGATFDGYEGIDFADAGEFPASWAPPLNGVYIHGSVDLSSYGLGGGGEYRLLVANGNADSGGGRWIGFVRVGGIDETPCDGVYTWAGMTDSWSSATNWFPYCVPGSGDHVIFDASSASNGVSLGGTRFVDEITFAENTAFEYVVFGGEIRLESGTLTVEDTGANEHSIVERVLILDSGVWNIEGNLRLDLPLDELDTPAGIEKTGGGTLQLRAAGDISTCDLMEGTIELRHDLALEHAVVDIADGATLDLSATTAPVFGGLAGTTDIEANGLDITVGSAGVDTTFSGKLKQANTLTKVGSGDLEFDHPTGATPADVFVEDGRLLIGREDTLHNANVEIAAGATVRAYSEAFFLDVGSLAGEGKFRTTHHGHLFVGNGQDQTFSGEFVADEYLFLHKEGGGTFELTGVLDSQINDVSADQGTLILNPSGSSYSFSDVEAISGTLAGNFHAADILVELSGALAPGAPIGVITCNRLEIGWSTTYYEFDLGGTTPETEYDQIQANNVTVAGGSDGHELRVSYVNDFVAAPGDTFRLIVTTDTVEPFTGFDPPDQRPWYVEYDDDGVVIGLPQTCAGDFNDDFVVDVADMLILLGEWGPCSGCATDLNGDGVVDVADVLALIGAWGSCE